MSKTTLGAFPRFLRNKEEEWFSDIQDPLTLLFRRTMWERGVKPYDWIEMTNTYFQECTPDMARGKISQEKSNLADALNSTKISFSRFAQAIAILAYADPTVKSIGFSVTFEREDPDDNTDYKITLLRAKRKRRRNI